MERDEETGLNYHTARYYAPWVARWVSADPIGVKGGLNLYGYCKSNPVIFLDITGNERSIAEINRTFDQGIRGDKVITLNELTTGIGSTTLSLTDWAFMMRVDNGGYRVDKDVQTIINTLTTPDPASTAADSEKAYESNETSLQYNSEGGTYTNREGREATKRWLNRHRDPKRAVATLEVGAAILVPEYYYAARSIYHSANGNPKEAALDLGGVFLIRFWRAQTRHQGVSNLADEEIESSLGTISSKYYYRSPVAVSEAGIAVETLVPTSRWGRPGLQPGDWIMPGPPNRLNHTLSFKWEPKWLGGNNTPAPFSAGEGYILPRDWIKRPSGFFGWIKELYSQRRYVPPPPQRTR